MKTPAIVAVTMIWLASLVLAFQLGVKKKPQESTIPDVMAGDSSAARPLSTPGVTNLKPPSREIQDADTPTSKIESYVQRRQSSERDRDEAPEDAYRDVRLPDLITQALDNGDPIERMSIFTEALKRLDASNVDAVLTAFEDRPGDHTDGQEFSMFLFAWARIDGASAMGYIDENMEGWESYRTAYSAMSGWANVNPEEAQTWAREKHEGPDNPYLIGVVNGVAKTDLARATEITESLPFGRIRGKAVDVLIDAYMKEGVDATMSWASNLDEGVLKNGIVSRVAGRVARDDPYAAADWAVTLVAGEERNNAVTSIVSSWSRSKPQEAADYSMNIPDDGLRAKALGEVVERWVRSDSTAVSDWLTQNKDRSGMDMALTEYAERIRFKDPVGAMTWAANIKDETSRHQLMEQVAEEWMERDPEAARDFLNRTP
ncbi:MAG: hypothetical protein ACI9TH_002250 [Kiritimatiellia bacterium]|jgi:hypothetical protein